MSYYEAIHLFYYFREELAIMSSNGTLTIQEASIMAGVSERTIYRYIKQGKLLCQTPVRQQSGRSQTLVNINKLDVERVFNIKSDTCQTIDRHLSDTCQTPVTELNLKENIKTVIEEYFENKTTQLMKPMEEQAIYIAGKLSTENQFLKERLETLRHENEVLREQVKALPGPAELENKDNMILLLQREKEEAINAKAELEQALKQAEEKQMEISEAWKKELELAKKPWWKFW